MSFFKRVWRSFFYKKLQIHILTIFLSLISIASLCIISYTYTKNSEAILKFSKGTIDRVSALIVERISSLTASAQRLPKIGTDVFTGQELSENNPKLITFLQDVMKLSPNLYAYYVGTAEGYFVEIDNIPISGQTHFLTDKGKQLPEGTAYGLRIVDRSVSPATETWTYKDVQFRTLATESILQVSYDPRVRPWYVGAAQTKALFGTDVYRYDPSGEPGITIANPVLNAEGGVVAVFGADLTLQTLSQFLKQQEIGRSGKAFVLDGLGEAILPLNGAEKASSQEILSVAYSKFKQSERSESDFVFKWKDIHYLVSIEAFPITAEKKWLIAIYVPLNDFFGELLDTQKEVCLLSVCILGMAAIFVVFFSKRISLPIVKLSNEVDRIKHLDFSSENRVCSNIKEISQMDESIGAMRIALRSFGRYVPKDIVKGLMEKRQEIVLEGERRETTVLFSDIAGFTSISETLPTEELMKLLATYFDRLSKIISEEDGTIDKYIGDSIMAFWNAPHDVPRHATQACLAALRCHRAVLTLCQEWKAENKPPFYTRFGIHTGTVIVGNIGTPDRMNYTVIGDVVNTASRLEPLNKEYHTSIIISDEVKQTIGAAFLTRPLDYVAIRGKKEKVVIHELIAVLEGNAEIKATTQQVALCAAFKEAHDAFLRGDTAKARALFEAISAQFPEDLPTQLYLNKMPLW